MMAAAVFYRASHPSSPAEVLPASKSATLNRTAQTKDYRVEPDINPEVPKEQQVRPSNASYQGELPGQTAENAVTKLAGKERTWNPGGGNYSFFYDHIDADTAERETQSPKIAQRIQPGLSKLENALRNSELQRAHRHSEERGTTRKTVRSIIKVSPPIMEEIRQAKELIDQEAGKLSAVDRTFFQVDAQRMLDAFTDFDNKTLVVFVNDPVLPDAEHQGDYHSYLTDTPEKFFLEASGQPSGAPNDATPNDTGIITDADGKVYFRYAHYFLRK